jgi:hypothetical protein
VLKRSTDRNIPAKSHRESREARCISSRREERLASLILLIEGAAGSPAHSVPHITFTRRYYQCNRCLRNCSVLIERRSFDSSFRNNVQNPADFLRRAGGSRMYATSSVAFTFLLSTIEIRRLFRQEAGTTESGITGSRFIGPNRTVRAVALINFLIQLIPPDVVLNSCRGIT